MVCNNLRQKTFFIDWKKLIAIIVILFVVAWIVYFSFFYRSIMQSKTEGFEQTEKIVSEALQMKVEEIYHFQEEEAYHILFTTDDQNKKWFVFVPLSKEIKKENFIVLEADNVLSKSTIESNWKKSCTNCELVMSKPAMIDNIPLWELTYKDEANRYVIEYVTLRDGTTYEQLRLKLKYSEKG